MKRLNQSTHQNVSIEKVGPDTRRRKQIGPQTFNRSALCFDRRGHEYSFLILPRIESKSPSLPSLPSTFLGRQSRSNRGDLFPSSFHSLPLLPPFFIEHRIVLTNRRDTSRQLHTHRADSNFKVPCTCMLIRRSPFSARGSPPAPRNRASR